MNTMQPTTNKQTSESAECIRLYKDSMCYIQRYSLKYAVLCTHTSKAIHTETIKLFFFAIPLPTTGGTAATDYNSPRSLEPWLSLASSPIRTSASK